MYNPPNNVDVFYEYNPDTYEMEPKFWISPSLEDEVGTLKILHEAMNDNE